MAGHNAHFSYALLTGLVFSGSTQAASVIDDDFADGVAGAQWSVLADNPSRLSLSESGGKLNLLASPGGSPNDDALYLSEFRISTASDFVIRLDYAFTGYGQAGAAGAAVGLVFGVGGDADGTDSAAIGQGFATAAPFGTPLTLPAGTVAYRTDDVTSMPVVSPLSTQTGTFEIAYAAAGDDLTLRNLDGSLSYVLADTVRGVWNADDLLVSFGGRGNGFGVASTAFVDNFTVVSGDLIVPEPAGFASLIIALGALTRRRRRL